MSKVKPFLFFSFVIGLNVFGSHIIADPAVVTEAKLTSPGPSRTIASEPNIAIPIEKPSKGTNITTDGE